jgi:hypothetical protein
MDFLLPALVHWSRRRANFENSSFFRVLRQANTGGWRAQLYLWTEVVQN